MNLFVLFFILVGVGVVLRALLPMTLRVATKVSVTDLRPLTAAFEARMVPYMQANYSGVPAQLESPVRGLLAIAREVANQQRDPVDEEILYTMIVTLVVARKFAKREQVQAALDSVRGTERLAA